MSEKCFTLLSGREGDWWWGVKCAMNEIGNFHNRGFFVFSRYKTKERREKVCERCLSVFIQRRHDKVCPDCRPEFYKENWKKKRRERSEELGALGRLEEYWFRKIIKSSGICLFCKEIDPIVLIEHHPLGRKINFTITLCANCHQRIHFLYGRGLRWKENRLLRLHYGY